MPRHEPRFGAVPLSSQQNQKQNKMKTKTKNTLLAMPAVKWVLETWGLTNGEFDLLGEIWETSASAADAERKISAICQPNRVGDFRG